MTKRKDPKDLLKVGAPGFEYSEEIAKEICFLISTTTIRLDTILKSDPRFPKRDTFYKWLFNNLSFAELYKLAKQRQQDILIESQEDELRRARESTYIDDKGNARIDSPAVMLAKIACDNIKWAAARLSPHKYGDNTKNETTLKFADEAIDEVAKRIKKAKEHEQDY